MIDYEPLTKLVSDKSGKPMAVCRYEGTEQCQLHKTNGCESCKNCTVFAFILEQLNTFESIYMEED